MKKTFIAALLAAAFMQAHAISVVSAHPVVTARPAIVARPAVAPRAVPVTPKTTVAPKPTILNNENSKPLVVVPPVHTPAKPSCDKKKETCK